MDLSAGGGIGQRLRDPRPSPLSFLYRRFRAPAQGTDDRAGQNGRGSQHGASQSVGSISDIQQKFPGVRQQQRRRRPGTSGAATGLAQTQEASPIRTNEYRRNRYRKGRGATGNQARALPLGSLGADGGASSALFGSGGVLVVGGSGLLGSQICRQFAQSGSPVAFTFKSNR